MFSNNRTRQPVQCVTLIAVGQLCTYMAQWIWINQFISMGFYRQNDKNEVICV